VRSKEFVQKVLIRILDHLYEPQFLDCSHGFRPGRSQHTCLKQIRREFGGALWYIVGDLSCKVLDHPSVGPGWNRSTRRDTGRPEDLCQARREQRTRLGLWGQKTHYLSVLVPRTLGAGLWFSKSPLGLVPQQKALRSWPKPRTLTKRMAIQLAKSLFWARFRALGLLTPRRDPGVVTHRGLRSTVRTTVLHRTWCVRPSSATERLFSHFLRDSRFHKRLRPIGIASLGRQQHEGPKGNTSAESLNRPQNGGHQKKPLVFQNSKHPTVPGAAPYSPLLANMQLHELDKFVLRLKHILEGPTTAPLR